MTVHPIVTTTYEVVVTDTIEEKSAIATVTVIPKKYDLEVVSDVAFDNQHIGYTDADVDTKSVSIKNSGNVDAANINATLSGVDAGAFTLDTTNMQGTLSPDRETSFSVVLKADLVPRTYTAQVEITGDNVKKSVNIAFTVNDHDYEDLVTAPTCTSKGYTTHTCKICGHSFVDSETDMIPHDFKNYVSNNDATCTEDGTETAKCENCDVTDTRVAAGSALEHDFGEWKVTKEATVTEKGEKVRTCSRCNTEEKEVLPMLGKELDKVNLDKNNNR